MSEVNSNSVLVVAYADRNYEMFAIPYVYFCLRNNTAACVEIFLEDRQSFVSRHKEAIDRLADIFGNRFQFRQSEVRKEFPGIVPNTVRFLEQPEGRADYVYIGDIDLLILDDLISVHTKLMAKYNLPFSNILRRNTDRPRLSGLHFCRFDSYYPVSLDFPIDFSVENDEHVLYLLMKAKGLMVPADFQIRPECGVHMSLSRDPIARNTLRGRYSTVGALGWGGRNYYKKLDEQLKEPSFMALYPYLSYQFRVLLLVLQGIICDEFYCLHRLAANYMLDKRLIFQYEGMDTVSIKEKLIDLAARDIEAAWNLFAVSALVWPANKDLFLTAESVFSGTSLAGYINEYLSQEHF